MEEPLAYFLTWTCYGNWLHGDERGSVDPAHNTVGDSRLGDDPTMRVRDRRAMAQPPFRLGDREREVVTAEIADVCLILGWELIALNVRTNHVHVVVRAAGARPERVMTAFKAWSTKRLVREQLVQSGRRVWTRHGSTRYLFTPADVNGAAFYVAELQGSERYGSDGS